MGVRVDKWLHVARVFKTRTKASHACELGRVLVNGMAVKAHRLLALGDRIELAQGDWQRVLVVKVLADKTLPRAAVPSLFEDLSPPRPVADPIARLLRRPPSLRDKGAGRPTKKERRSMQRFVGDEEEGEG